MLTRLTSALIAADKTRDTDKIGFARALGKNLEFWTVVATDVAGNGNQLPTELRSQLFYLYEFTRHHTNKIMKSETDANVHPLIEINQNIMLGLQGQPRETA